MLETIGASITKAEIEKLVARIHQHVGESGVSRGESKSFKEAAAKLQNQVKAVRFVKTLWQVDKAVDLADFYCYPHIESSSVKRKQITCLKDLPLSRAILIQGVAGQGKTLLLRYLCAQELQAAEAFPIFVELRKMKIPGSLITLISEWFEVIGVKVKFETISDLLAKERFIFFLDGFDEVPPELKNEAIGEIERLVLRNGISRTIVSSRPNNGIEASPYLENVCLDYLRDSEYSLVIDRLAETPELAADLNKCIDRHPGDVRDLLVTPLLVTLLVVSYKTYQEIPDQLSDFFDTLFHALLSRHDGSKPGFTRRRACQINDKQYRSIFESFALESKRIPRSEYAYKELCDVSERASLRAGIEVDSVKYLEDIIGITCLIVKDGEKLRYLHRSIQEFYTASFINNLPEELVLKFYEHMQESDGQKKWVEELSYLSEIDDYRYRKYFRIPLLSRFLKINPEVGLRRPENGPLYVEYFFGRYYVHIGLTGRAHAPLAIRFEHDNQMLGPIFSKYISEKVFDTTGLTPFVAKLGDDQEFVSMLKKLRREKGNSLFLIRYSLARDLDIEPVRKRLFHEADKILDRIFRDLKADWDWVAAREERHVDLDYLF